MGFAEEVDAHAALADAAADGLRQFAVQQRLLEGQLRALLAAADFQLAAQGVRIHADAHGGDLQGDVQQRIVEQDVAVQVPVIIVRGTAVMRFPAAQGAAHLHQEYGAVFPGCLIFPFL